MAAGDGHGAKHSGVLLDFHVARSMENLASTTRATGQVMFRALCIDKSGVHTVASDLESLLYSLMYIASDGRALLWRHKSVEDDLYNCKLATMVSTERWDRALTHCMPQLKALLQAWHNIIFVPCRDNFYAYRQGVATTGNFMTALQAEAHELGISLS
jgi:hypothetical protein